MSESTTRKPPARYLTHDEVEQMPSKTGELYAFRIRIWRGVNAIPVVLVSQVPGGVPPQWMVSKLSNYINATLLGHPEHGMLYFADEEIVGCGRALSQAYFEFFGTSARKRLYRPIHLDKRWDFLESALGEKIER